MHPDPEHATTILHAYLEAGVTLQVGDGESPENPVYPYLVVSPLAPFDIEGPIDDGNADHAMEWQVTGVGRYRLDAQGAIAAATDRMLDPASDPDFSGMTPAYKFVGEVVLVPGPAFEQDTSKQPPIFLAFQTYRLKLTPA